MNILNPGQTFKRKYFFKDYFLFFLPLSVILFSFTVNKSDLIAGCSDIKFKTINNLTKSIPIL